jgi:hypothetical protein
MSILSVLLFLATNEVMKIAIFLAIGIFFGTGLLAFLTYFWDLTVLEERGRIAGLIGFISLPLYFIIGFGVAETLDFLGTIMLSTVLSLTTLAVMLKIPKKSILTAKKDERGTDSEKRTVVLYTIPWVVFSLINATLAVNISFNAFQRVSSSFYLFLLILQLVAAAFGALSGGIIADFFGRRLSLALGLTLFGLSSALVGLVNNDAIFPFVYAANGLSWGILLTMYSFVVWGDLSNEKNCARMYSIGLATYYSTIGIGVLVPEQIIQFPLAISALASCMLIFLSNLPIVLAPELLSSDFREKIKLKMHMRALKRVGKKSQN